MGLTPGSCSAAPNGPAGVGKSRLAAAIAVASLVLGACEADPSQSPPRIERMDLALYLPQFVELGESSGVLTSRAGCLFFESDRGVTYGTGWPAEFTTWDPQSRTIRVRQAEATVGDRVTLGGGAEKLRPTV